MNLPTAIEFELVSFLAHLTQRPGIYKMLDVHGKIIYIGKAKNLKNRVSSYFKTSSNSAKQQKMLAKMARIEVTITQSEAEALLLESQQIKHHQPRYNICLRDDKSYPYILITTADEFPRLSFYRGAKTQPGRYFGPYPSAKLVKETLQWLPSIFPVRQCDDSFYKNRSRPCLQYQIQRCTAPCVGLVNAESYQQDVAHTLLFLEGKGDDLIEPFVQKMQQASKALNFEHAAMWRDKISRLRAILEKQAVHGECGDVDIIACATEAESACVQVFMIRHGQNLGNREFFPKMNAEQTAAEVIAAFIPQYYLDQPIPEALIVSHPLTESKLLIELLATQAQHSVTISTPTRGEQVHWLKMALINASNALATQLADKQSIKARFVQLQQQLHCPSLPERLECVDISHTQGQQTVASFVVFTHEGMLKSAYRRFNIDGIRAGDDYAAIHQAVLRRFKRIQHGEFPVPDILLIDGGKGQVQQAQCAVNEVGLNNVMIIGVAKGADRKVGMEKLIVANQTTPLVLGSSSAALLLIQQVRDEAHRFAITGHRQRRGKAQNRSLLEDISGLGPKKQQQLLQQFGGLQALSSASVEALSRIKGISSQLAHRIYDTFHP